MLNYYQYFVIFTIEKASIWSLSLNLTLLNSVGVIYETDKLTLHTIRV